jgi:hypothetical protein
VGNCLLTAFSCFLLLLLIPINSLGEFVLTEKDNPAALLDSIGIRSESRRRRKNSLINGEIDASRWDC